MARVVSKKSLFVVMPSVNVWNMKQPGTEVSFLRSTSRSLRRLAEPKARASVALGTRTPIEVLDEVAPNETILIALTEVQQRELAESQPGLRLVPVVPVHPLWLRRFELTPPVPVLAAGRRRTTSFSVTVVADDTGKPCVGIEVYAFTDRVGQVGVQSTTDAAGVAKLLVQSCISQFEVVEGLAPDGYWPVFVRKAKVTPAGVELRCAPIASASRQCAR